MTTGKTGVDIYDFSTPESPTKLGSWATNGLADIAVDATATGRTIYAATEYWFNKQTKPRIVQLDATNLGAIKETRRFSPSLPPLPAGMDWQVQGLDLADGLLYAAHSHAGLAVLDPCCGGEYVRAATTDLGEANTGSVFPNTAPYAMDVEADSGVIFVTEAATGTLSTFALAPIPQG